MNLLQDATIDDHVLKLIWNNSTDAILVIGHSGAIINGNPAFQNMLGWELVELESMEFPPFIMEMTKQEHETFIHQLKEGHNFPYKIVKRRGKDGSILDILASYWSVNNDRILAIGMYKDFTEQALIQRKLEASEYCYRTLVEYLPEAIVKQTNGKIQFVNSTGMKLFGIARLEMAVDRSIWNFISSDRKDDIQQMISTIYEHNSSLQPKTIVAKLKLQGDKEIWAEVKVIPIGSKDEPEIQIVFRDVTEKKRYENALEHLAYHDPLTGLKNRRAFQDIALESLEAAKRNLGKLAMLYIDLDKFKLINDTYGHDKGDQLLQAFAQRIASSIRSSDMPCRVGGDEFLVLLTDIKDEEEIIRVVDRMITSFQEPYDLNQLKLNVTSSIGISVFPKDGQNVEQLIYHADLALYEAKKERNHYQFYSN